MAKYLFSKGETSVILPVFIQDSSSSTGAGLGSLDESSNIVGGFMKRGGLGIALAVDENVTTEGTYQAPSTAAQVRIGTPANMRTGVYELHFHNDLFTTADYVIISLGGATNMADLLMEIQLTSINVNDGVHGGMTALPNAAADAIGGLPISDAGGLDMDAILIDTTNLNDTGITELTQAQPDATPTLRDAVMLMYMAIAQRLDVPSTGTPAIEIHNSSGTRIALKVITDSGGDYSEARMITGA